MDLVHCYSLLEVPATATDEEVAKAFKKLAHRLHPDKNQNRIEWATRAMANLNIAYTTITSHRFENAQQAEPHEEERPAAQPPRPEPARARAASAQDYRENLQDDIITNRFIQSRETAKDALYRYFQYSLYNMFRRENPINRGIFNEVVTTLRKCFHEIKKLTPLTRDRELLEHFAVFGEMIFNFYRSSECVTIPDSYASMLDVEAYRMYRRGDEALHIAHKELFYDRHNRGSFRRDIVEAHILKAAHHFKDGLTGYPESTWEVETRIKLEYAVALRKYLALFFTGSDN
ncbi:MAG: J domain-containing protein [Spirochaetes bacterium]|nr:MAG: J domain-containing protein [Spirochaetota bacterium]